MRILFVSNKDVRNVHAWSGTPSSVYARVAEMFDSVDSLRVTPSLPFRIAAKIVKRIYGATGHNVDLYRTRFYTRSIAGRINRDIAERKPDLIVGIASSIELSAIEAPFPIIHISDATFDSMLDFYPEFSHVPENFKRMGHEIEKAVLSKAARVVLSSDWASCSAQCAYGVPADKIDVVPLGANVAAPEPAALDAKVSRQDAVCTILFVGKDWSRKGGDFALEVFNTLIAERDDFRLVIVGCKPPHPVDDRHITVYENLSKANAEEAALMDRLFLEATVFFLPTRAEAYGLVFAEAAAFGLPSVAPRLGGIPTIIKDGETGLLIEPNAGARAYAAAIAGLWDDKTKLAALSRNARIRYETHLSWDAWSERFRKVVQRAMET